MSELIKGQVQLAQDEIEAITGSAITEDRAFSHCLLKYLFDLDYSDQIGMVTDGANDGGIDFLFYDEEDSKVILCQSKYTGTISFEQIINEFNKMYSTVQNFKKSNSGSYNERLKVGLQNAIDRLPDENNDNFEYCLFTIAPVDVTAAMNKIENSAHEFPTESVFIYTADDIEKAIQRSLEALSTVESEKIKLDRANNFLEYESKDSRGILCNVLSSSLITLYNKYAAAGLFDLNIRRYIKNTLVDSGIKNTLDRDRENFWFLNNGIIIACEEYEIDGNVVKLSRFSIVNGGQTTTLIGNYKGTNTREFYIPCKIVASKTSEGAETFFTKIAEATNSQKPIYARDLKSNAPEMVRLANWLRTQKVYLGIKRGLKPGFKPDYSINNDELGQLILSFALQKPGTSRSGKKVIFENQVIYDQIFKNNYAKDPLKKQFLLDLITVNDKYSEIEKKLKASDLNSTQVEILKNGRQTLFALIGMCYRLANGDIKEGEIIENPKSLGTIPFVYGPIMSSYRGDDYEDKFEAIVRDLVVILADAYQQAFDNSTTTSVSNFMKTDLKYYNDIATKVVVAFKYIQGKDLVSHFDLLKR